MKEFKTLKMLDRVKFLFKNSKVDYDTMRSILQIKLTMDSRRESTFAKSQNKDDKDIENSFLKSYWIYGLFGLFMIPFAFLGKTPFVGLNLFFAIILFMLISSMISDFSSIILDTKDKVVLLTKPVSNETLTMARFIHILIYLMSLMIVLALPGILAFTYKFGILFGILLLFIMSLLCLLSLLGTSFIYTILMKFFDGEKLKDIINVFQIFFIITLNIGYQLVIRMFNFIDFEFVFVPSWWTYLLPPAWFAAPFEVIFFNRFEIEYIILSVLAVIIPVISFIIHKKIIAPGFEQYLSKLDSVEKGVIVKKNFRYKVREKIFDLFSSTDTEKSFIKFTRVMLKKERSVKFKIYPIIAMALIFPFIFIAMTVFDDHGGDGLNEIMKRSTVFYFYFSAIMINPIILMTSYSDSYKGAWIYGVMPIKDKNEVLKGSIKSLLITYVLPIVALFMILSMFLYGIYGFLDMIIIFSSSFVSMMVSFRTSKKIYPFSEKFTQESQKSDATKNLFLSFAIMAVYFGIHKIVQTNNLYIIIAACLAIIVNFIMWKTSFNGNWETYE